MATTTEFVWDVVSDNVMMEKDGAGNTQAVYTQEPRQFGRLISQRRDGITSQYHFDTNGNCRHLSNASEDVSDSFVHTAFGDSVTAMGGTPNRYRFAAEYGYQHCAKTTLHYVRARMYQPSSGRWMSKDPSGFVDGANIYAYVRNHPVSAVDPSGNELFYKGTARDANTVASWFFTYFGVKARAFPINCVPRGYYYIVTDARANHKLYDILNAESPVANDGRNLTGWEEDVYWAAYQRHTHQLVTKSPGWWHKEDFTLCTHGQCGVRQMLFYLRRMRWSAKWRASLHKSYAAELAQCKQKTPTCISYNGTVVKWPKAPKDGWTNNNIAFCYQGCGPCNGTNLNNCGQCCKACWEAHNKICDKLKGPSWAICRRAAGKVQETCCSTCPG